MTVITLGTYANLMASYPVAAVNVVHCHVYNLLLLFGKLAQMVERSLSMREVTGSMPVFSIITFFSASEATTVWRYKNSIIIFLNPRYLFPREV